MTHIDYLWYAAHVSDANKDVANDAARAVGGNFCNPYDDLFSIPCHTDTGDTPTRWGTKIRLDPTQRETLGGVLGGLGIVTRELRARGPKLPDDFDLFLADSQLRQYKNAMGFVHTTGTFKSNGSEDAQTIGTGGVIIEQWSSASTLVNVSAHYDDGHSLRVDYGGTYFFELHPVIEDVGIEWEMRMLRRRGVALLFVTPWFDPVGTITHTQESVQAGDEFMIVARAKSGSGSFNLLSGWFGLKRTAK